MTTNSRPPVGRENCSSADRHAEDIRQTFLEEKELDTVLGPFTSEQAAKVCGCGVSELCPGRMAAKVRAIYDGSSGGVLVLSGQNGQSVEN